MPNKLITTQKNNTLDQFRQNANEIAGLVANSIQSEELISNGGFLSGWNISIENGTPDKPQYIIWSKQTQKVRIELTWGTSGGSVDNVTKCVVSYSDDNGTSWEIFKGIDENGDPELTEGHFTLTYNADGYFTSGVWT